MTYSKIIPALIAACLLAGTASAGVVTDIVLTDTEGDAANMGTIGFITSLGNAVGVSDSGFNTSRTFTYTVTGLDLAGDNTANDSVVFGSQFTSTSTVMGAGVAVTNAGNSNGAFGVGPNGAFGNFDVNEIDGGESLTLTSLAPVITLGDGQTVMNVTFNGFQGLETFFVNADPNNTLTGATVDGNASLPGSANGATFAFDTPFPTGPITFGGDPTGNGFYVGDFSQSFTIEVAQAIPEPSSIALFGFGGLALVSRRKRR